jgi:translation initiation factor 5A
MIEIKKLRKGDFIVYKDVPFRVKGIGSKVIGTHSHSVTKVDLEGLLDKSSESITKSPHEKVEDIEIVRRLGQYIAPSGESMVQVMDMDTYEVFDAEVLPEVKPGITDGCSLTYIEFRGRKIVTEVRK